MGEVVPARTSPTLHPPPPPHCASFVATSTVRAKKQKQGSPVDSEICQFVLLNELKP